MNEQLIMAIIGIVGTLLVVIFGGLGWTLRRLLIDVRKLVIDVELMKANMTGALKLEDEVKTMKEKVLRIELTSENHEKRIESLVESKHEILQQLSQH